MDQRQPLLEHLRELRSRLIRAVIAFVSGDIATVARLIGSRTVNQEIQQELKGTDDGLGQEGVE